MLLLSLGKEAATGSNSIGDEGMGSDEKSDGDDVLFCEKMTFLYFYEIGTTAAQTSRSQ